MREKSPEPGESGGSVVDLDLGGEVATDHEVRAFTASDLVGDHGLDDPCVLVVGDVEAAVAQRHGIRRKLGEQRRRGQVEVLIDHDAAQGRAVILGDEAALAHLTVGHHGEDLAGDAVYRQRDVSQQFDIDDLAGEQLDGVGAVSGDQHERRRGICGELGKT